MSGWIKIHRALTRWEWFTDVNTCHLFLYLLLEANHKETKWRGHTIMAGQLLTGRIKLSEATGLSQQNVRTSLDKLKSTNEVTSKTFNKYSIITITKWDKYQDINQQVTSELTNNQPATNHIQEYKEYKEYKEYTSEDISSEVWEDFKKLRNKKKAPITKTAMDIIIKQAAMAKYSLEEALRECCTRGWSSFKADWVNKNIKSTTQSTYKDERQTLYMEDC